MRVILVILACLMLWAGPVVAQEEKPTDEEMESIDCIIWRMSVVYMTGPVLGGEERAKRSIPAFRRMKHLHHRNLRVRKL